MFDVNVNNVSRANLMGRKIVKNNLNNKPNPNAFYMAIVEDTNDPYRLGRVRIRIPGIHGISRNQAYYLPNDSLPWAKPAILNGAGNDQGQFIVPSRGTRVFVTFEFNDFDKPLYFGGAICVIGAKDKIYNDNPDIYSSSDVIVNTDDRITDIDGEAYQVLYKSLKGSTILINDKDGKECIKIIDAAGQQIIMENNDLVPLDRRENKTNPPETASISIITNGNLNLNSNKLNINTNSSNYKFSDNFKGDGTKTVFEFNINLNSLGIAQLLDKNNNVVTNATINVTKTKCTITFSSAPSSSDTYTITVIS